MRTFFLIAVLAVSAFAQKQPVTIFLSGDSTCAPKTDDRRPETGWGEMLGKHFKDGTVVVENRAANGRSTKTFISEGSWQKILDDMKKGDWVFIQFGHNDESKEKGERYSPPDQFRANLVRMVNDVRAKGGNPLFLTPVMRRRFDKDGNFVDQHPAEYPDAFRSLSKELKVPLIDMHRKTEVLIKGYGVEGSKQLFLQLKPDEHPNFPKGVDDNTHYNPKGADEAAALVVEGIRENKLKLVKLLRSPQPNEFRSRLTPAPMDGGFKMDGFWVWCGSVIKGEEGKYHMFASRWPKPPGFGPYWLTNSEIVHAISDKPEGPYKFNDVALAPRGEQYWDGQMTHNPAIRKYRDTYLLYYTGTTYTGPRPGMDFRISETHPKKLEAHRQERIGLATSKSPYGPWKRLDKPILDVVPGAWDQYLTSNAAPVVMKDGRVMLYYKGVTRLTVHAIGLAIADRFDAEYKRVGNEPLNMGIGAEDPFIWVENGKFKALMLDHERKYSPDKEIFFATSNDGIKWSTPPDAIAVSRSIKMADGSMQRVAKTERPHVLIENGKPTTVFFAVRGQLNGQGASWNAAIPLKK